MARKLLGDLEQKIMNVIWESDSELKPSEVKEKLCADCDDEYAYTTIMTILSRLHKKELLDRKKKGKAYYYTAAEKKADYAQSKLKKVFGNIINSYRELAITQFVDALKESPEDLDKLKKIIENEGKTSK